MNTCVFCCYGYLFKKEEVPFMAISESRGKSINELSEPLWEYLHVATMDSMIVILHLYIVSIAFCLDIEILQIE